jgi:hypothetical protein
MECRSMNTRKPTGTVSVELWRAGDSPQWAVVRWQDGPLQYRPLSKHPTEREASAARREARKEIRQ